MKRQAAAGEFRSNLHRGGSASLIRLTPEERSTAVRAAQRMGLNVSGVDILRSNHGPVVLEVNSSPGLEGIEDATGRDVAGLIVKFIENNARHGKTRPGQRVSTERLNTDLQIGGESIPPGGRATIALPVPQLYTHTPLTMPVQVVRGRRDGPLFVCAAVHGDELNGVEIIRRLLRRPALARLRGTLIAIPIVNVYGLLHQSRYLPDRRDLNRSFPVRSAVR